MPSTPGAPLLRTTARNAASMLSGSQIASIRSAVCAGRSGSAIAVTTSTSCEGGRGASPRPGIGRSSISWIGGRAVVMTRPSYLPSPSTPHRGPFGPSDRRGGLLRPLLTSAPWSGDLAVPSVRRDCRRTRCRSPGVSPVSFLAHPPDLQSRPLMDMDFATVSPLVRPVLPRIRFLFVGSRFRSTLPSDGPSRFRPCASLVLHLHHVAQGTFTPRTLGMPSTLTLRAGCAGAAPRHHGPHLRARPDLLSVGAREWSPRSNKRMTTVWLNQLLDCRRLAKRCDDRLNPGNTSRF